ncbi:MAG: hypothetical protein Q8S09_04200 [Hyphomonas sp.]|nr:hypothetical protein [Hyphomonas sp.]
MIPHTARASSQPLAVATFGFGQTVRVVDDYPPAPAPAPVIEPAEPERLDLLSRQRRRRARLDARR